MSKFQFKSTRILTALAANVAAFGLLAGEAVQTEENVSPEETNVSLNVTGGEEEGNQPSSDFEGERPSGGSDLNQGQNGDAGTPVEGVNDQNTPGQDSPSAKEPQATRVLAAESTNEGETGGSQKSNDDNGTSEGAADQTTNNFSEEAAGPDGTPEDLGFTVGEAQPVEADKSLDVEMSGLSLRGAF